MSEAFNEHAWFVERIAASLAGGLSPDETQRFSSHAAACPGCSGQVDPLRRFDSHLIGAFDPTHADGIEERIIAAVSRDKSRRRFLSLPRLPHMNVHPLIFRAGSAVAAALVLASVGYVAEPALNGGPVNLPSFLAWAAPAADRAGSAISIKAASSLRSINEDTRESNSVDMSSLNAITGMPAMVAQRPERIQHDQVRAGGGQQGQSQAAPGMQWGIAGGAFSDQTAGMVIPSAKPADLTFSYADPNASPAVAGVELKLDSAIDQTFASAAGLAPSDANNAALGTASLTPGTGTVTSGLAKYTTDQLDDLSKSDGIRAPIKNFDGPSAGISNTAAGARGGGGFDGGITKAGAGTLEINADGSPGTLTLDGNAPNLGTGKDAVTLNGANGYTGNTTVTAGTLDTNGNTVTIDGALTNSSAAGLTKVGSGNLAFAPANVYTGPTKIDNSDLGLSSMQSLGASSSMNFNVGGLALAAPQSVTAAPPTYFQPDNDAKKDIALSIDNVSGGTLNVHDLVDGKESKTFIGNGTVVIAGVIPTDSFENEQTSQGKAGHASAGGTDPNLNDAFTLNDGRLNTTPSDGIGAGVLKTEAAEQSDNKTPSSVAGEQQANSSGLLKYRSVANGTSADFGADFALLTPSTAPPSPSATTPPPTNAPQAGKSSTGGTSPDAQPPVQQPARQQPAQAVGPIVIRSGTMEFEVQNFDVALVMIQSIVTNDGGYISTTDSQKLANGKVQGSVTLRVPPRMLDDLVIKLRPLGDLKGEKIAAQDITKDYTDLQSELRAASAMQDRLIEDIKTGKGEMKDLVVAEQQLGQWREKIEQITGEINYYNNLVSMATLTVMVTEKDIAAAVSSAQTQTIDAGLEADDVSATRDAVLKLIDDAKGQVISSDMKQLDAGQFAATVVAQVPPDAAAAMIDQIRAFKNSKVARLEVTRQTTTSGPNGAQVVTPTVDNGNGIAGPDKIERKAAVFNLSIYNLANVAPRVTNVMSLVCTDDVETVYHSILDGAAKAGGRVVGSSLNRPKPEQVSASINIEVPAVGADAMLASIRAMGQVMHLTVTENPDTANVTTAKQGFNIQVVSWSSVPPREVRDRSIAATPTVHDSFTAVRTAAIAAGARVLAENDQGQTGSAAASLDLEVPAPKAAAVESVIDLAGVSMSSQLTRSTDTDNTLDDKVEIKVAFVDMDALAPRESVQRKIAVADVPGAYRTILGAAQDAGARVSVSQLYDQQAPLQTAELHFQVLRSKQAAVESAIDKAGVIFFRQVNRADEQANTVDAKVELELLIADTQAIPPRQATVLNMTATDPVQAAGKAVDATLKVGGRVILSDLTRSPDGISQHVVLDIPASQRWVVVDALDKAGIVKSENVISQDNNAPAGIVERTRIDATIQSEDQIVAGDTGLWTTFKNGISTSVVGLLWSVKIIVIGLLLVGPWALLAWAGLKLTRLRKKKPAAG